MMTADGYIRVSRRMGRKGPGYISPDVQREAIERWAEYKGVAIAAWHVDEDETGGSHDRPGLNAAVERAVTGQTGGIVYWRIDRFSRFTEGGLRDLRRLQDAGARLVFVVEDIDTSGPMGKFVYTVMLAMSEYVLDSLKAGWITAKTRAVERGAHIGPTPLGYTRNGDGILRVHPDRGAIVTEAFEAAARDGLGAAVDYLAGLGLTHENGKRKGRPLSFTAFTTRRLLSNETYLGRVAYGDDLSHPDAHDPLVTPDVFRAVGRRLGSGERVRAPKAEFPLSGGLAVCGSCGAHLVGGRGGLDKRRMYRCSARCDAPVALSAEPLEQHVSEVFLDGLKGLHAHGTTVDEDVAALDYLAREAEETYTRAVHQLAGLDDASVRERLLGLRQAADDALDALDDARDRQGSPTLSTDLAGMWPDLSAVERRQLLEAGLDRVEVQRGRGPIEERCSVRWRG